jgi:hypothetical protein
MINLSIALIAAALSGCSHNPENAKVINTPTQVAVAPVSSAQIQTILNDPNVSPQLKAAIQVQVPPGSQFGQAQAQALENNPTVSPQLKAILLQPAPLTAPPATAGGSQSGH